MRLHLGDANQSLWTADNFDLTSSHVIPALIRKAHEAKVNGEGGTGDLGLGTPRREFLHVDDAADALVYIMTHYSDDEHVNVGCGCDITIKELASLVAEVIGFKANIATDPSNQMVPHASCSTSANL